MLLAFEPALLRSERRPGRPPRGGTDHGLAQEFDQSLDGVGAIALLGAEALGVDDDDAVLGHALAGETFKPYRRIVRDHDGARVEAQLRRGRQLVDVLPAR